MKIYNSILTQSSARGSSICVGGLQASNEKDQALIVNIAKRLNLPLHTKEVKAINHLHVPMEVLISHLKSNPPDGSEEDYWIYQTYLTLQARISPTTPPKIFGREWPAAAIDSTTIASPGDKERGIISEDQDQATQMPSGPQRKSPPRSPPREQITQSGGVFLDPSSLSFGVGIEDPHTLQLAREQTAAARACLYWPSEELTKELAVASRKLLNFISSLKDSALVIGFCARVFGPEGLRPDARLIDATADQKFLFGDKDHPTPAEDKAREELAVYCKSVLRSILTPIANGQFQDKPELGDRRAMVIALMGDIGAFMAATGATTGTERPKWVSDGLQKAFAAFALKLEGRDLSEMAAVSDSVHACKRLGGGETVGPTKSKERIRVKDEAHLPRTGIHDTGHEADESLERLEKSGTLPPSTWATARLADTRIGSHTIEPFAGHMSASPSEILWTWDVLAGRGLDYAYCGSAGASPSTQNQFSGARCAGTCAFLVGCGYHSAVEVIHGAMAYQGHVPDPDVLISASESGRPDVAGVFKVDAATKLVVDMLQESTSRPQTGVQRLPNPMGN